MCFEKEPYYKRQRVEASGAQPGDLENQHSLYLPEIFCPTVEPAQTC